MGTPERAHSSSRTDAYTNERVPTSLAEASARNSSFEAYGLALLTEVYELGLLAGKNLKLTELQQQILEVLRRVSEARCACWLAYQPIHHCFVPLTPQGIGPAWHKLAASLKPIYAQQLAARSPGENLASLQVDGWHTLVLPLSYAGTLAGAVVLCSDTSFGLAPEQKLLLAYLGNVAALLHRNYALHAEQQRTAIEHERQRIARDIHDSVAQQMTYALRRLELVQYLLENQPQLALTEARRTQNIVKTALAELRHCIATLLPERLQGQSLALAIRNLLDEYTQADPILEITCESDDLQHIPAPLEAPAYRLIREALNNVRKHAHATHVLIQVRLLANLLIIEVRDNGIGFEPEQICRQARDGQLLGLRAMQEGVEEAGGTWEIYSRPGHGTTVRANYPLLNVAATLTEREREVLRGIVKGHTNRHIAEQLSISVETVKSHVRHIMQKMQVKGRTQAAILATRQGWL
ncbi:hypothetical protein EPA93_33400 [Ktedonosporobacter rubrisoli]|uniref:Oxygen sensor histidine kinase NreB n=1 Tax=Ktedonosporobacter rubrisoli TaxID=2509675 RepID=A0A4P6JXV5_KTERU|nr:LuxR C-terminal-related transcriptional regulator [Ktedonosporobacter rubrisoli]QBD80608.1 hypothetical protein EPA93_33400 [Ktedonosporobacter rubrisoli]